MCSRWFDLNPKFAHRQENSESSPIVLAATRSSSTNGGQPSKRRLLPPDGETKEDGLRLVTQPMRSCFRQLYCLPACNEAPALRHATQPIHTPSKPCRPRNIKEPVQSKHSPRVCQSENLAGTWMLMLEFPPESWLLPSLAKPEGCGSKMLSAALVSTMFLFA